MNRKVVAKDWMRMRMRLYQLLQDISYILPSLFIAHDASVVEGQAL
jgi:hypothetical protein